MTKMMSKLFIFVAVAVQSIFALQLQPAHHQLPNERQFGKALVKAWIGHRLMRHLNQVMELQQTEHLILEELLYCFQLILFACIMGLAVSKLINTAPAQLIRPALQLPDERRSVLALIKAWIGFQLMRHVNRVMEFQQMEALIPEEFLHCLQVILSACIMGLALSIILQRGINMGMR